jgi:hypothetical protein
MQDTFEHAEYPDADLIVHTRHRIQHAAVLVDYQTIIHATPVFGRVMEVVKSAAFFSQCKFFKVDFNGANP